MPRPNLLDKEDIELYKDKVPEWKQVDNSINREFICSNFAAAMGLVNSIAFFAEAADHHPDILIYGWNKVRVTLSTHDRGGLTFLDFELAQKIDTIKIDIN